MWAKAHYLALLLLIHDKKRRALHLWANPVLWHVGLQFDLSDAMVHHVSMIWFKAVHVTCRIRTPC